MPFSSLWDHLEARFGILWALLDVFSPAHGVRSPCYNCYPKPFGSHMEAAVTARLLQPMALRASSSPPDVAARLRRPPPARLRRHSSPPAGAPLTSSEICVPWVHDESANAQLDVNRGPRCQLLRIRAACDEVFGHFGGMDDIPEDVLVHDMWSEIAGFCTDGF